MFQSKIQNTRRCISNTSSFGDTLSGFWGVVKKRFEIRLELFFGSYFIINFRFNPIFKKTEKKRMRRLVKYSLHDPYTVQTSVHLNPAFAGEWLRSRKEFLNDFKEYVRDTQRLLDKVCLLLLLSILFG
jgi:hypothetical protein